MPVPQREISLTETHETLEVLAHNSNVIVRPFRGDELYLCKFIPDHAQGAIPHYQTDMLGTVGPAQNATQIGQSRGKSRRQISRPAARRYNGVRQLRWGVNQTAADFQSLHDSNKSLAHYCRTAKHLDEVAHALSQTKQWLCIWVYWTIIRKTMYFQ